MSDAASHVIQHYETGPVLERIKAGLKEAGVKLDHVTPEDLKPVDEFHTGGLEATEELLMPLGITKTTRVLDIGSGIGGTARFIATRFGATVHGVDLTPEFVQAAEALSAMVGLADKTRFEVGSALDLPVPEATVDLVTMMHVGMNIEDKPALFAEVDRVLVPGGRFALFDIMKPGDLALPFPVPWASTQESSFVDTPKVYRDAASSAGLSLIAERDRTDYAIDFFTRITAASDGTNTPPPPLGLHLLMGAAAPERYGNAVRAALGGATAPWEMIFEKPK